MAKFTHDDGRILECSLDEYVRLIAHESIERIRRQEHSGKPDDEHVRQLIGSAVYLTSQAFDLWHAAVHPSQPVRAVHYAQFSGTALRWLNRSHRRGADPA